jgi:hypothetical protein
MTLVADGRLSRFRNAVLFESLPEQRGNFRSFSPFDLVPLEQKQNLAVAEQTDRGRGGRITFEIAAGPFGCLNIRACEDRYHILWPNIILKRKREAGSRTTRSASADRIDHHHDGTLCAGDGSVDRFRRSGFSYSDVCEVLPHWFDQQF